MDSPSRIPPGADLEFTRRLKLAGEWPPYVPWQQYHSSDRQASPFLFVPTSSQDLGLRPTTGTAWVRSPGIFFLDDQGMIEFAPQCGATYRILVLIGNSGNVPVLNGLAEFYSDFPPVPTLLTADGSCYIKTPLLRKFRVGVAPFSVGSRDLSWSLSPPWTPHNWDLGECIIVQVYDPINDRASPELKSWEDRQVGFRVLTENVAGTWSGQEIGNDGGVLGEVTLRLTINWALDDMSRGVLPPLCEIDPIQFPHIPGRDIAINVTKHCYMLYGVASFLMVASDNSDNCWSVHIENRTVKSVTMRTQKGSTQISHAVLALRTPERPPPLPDLKLLSRVRRQVLSTWSPQKRADAKLVFHAIAAQGI